MTGLLLAKRLELLREITPGAGLTGYLLNSSNPNSESQSRDVYEAARALGLELHTQSASSDPDFEMAFEAFSQRRVGALFIGNDPFFLARRQQIVAWRRATRCQRAISAVSSWPAAV
jgi:putative ABC transport system substrate-binding protein